MLSADIATECLDRRKDSIKQRICAEESYLHPQRDAGPHKRGDSEQHGDQSAQRNSPPVLSHQIKHKSPLPNVLFLSDWADAIHRGDVYRHHWIGGQLICRVGIVECAIRKMSGL